MIKKDSESSQIRALEQWILAEMVKDDPSDPIAHKVSQLAEEYINEGKSNYDYMKALYVMSQGREQSMVSIIKRFKQSQSGFFNKMDNNELLFSSKNTIDRERTRMLLQGFLTEKDDKSTIFSTSDKRESRLSTREQLALNDDIDPVVELIEEGVCKYISGILQELKNINIIINTNKTMNSNIRERNLFPQSTPSSIFNVLLYDPWGEYKMVEKLEMDIQKRYENKMQNREQQKPDAPEEKQSQKAASDAGGQNAQGGATGQPPKKKKPVFEDYTEIYRVLLKNKQEKLKENDSKDKNAEDQKKCISMFASEGNFNSQRNATDSNFIRREPFPERRDVVSNSITMQHLIFFFENSIIYRCSKFHFKANMLT